MRIKNYPHIHYMRIKNYPHINYMQIKPTYFIYAMFLDIVPNSSWKIKLFCSKINFWAHFNDYHNMPDKILNDRLVLRLAHYDWIDWDWRTWRHHWISETGVLAGHRWLAHRLTDLEWTKHGGWCLSSCVIIQIKMIMMD